MTTLFPRACCGRRTSVVRTVISLLAVLAVLAVAACDDSSTAPETPAMATIELRNDANVPIVSVHIAKCSDAEGGRTG